jgi:hypothetical protein
VGSCALNSGQELQEQFGETTKGIETYFPFFLATILLVTELYEMK